MRSTRLIRSAIMAAIAIFLVCGCSGGGVVSPLVDQTGSVPPRTVLSGDSLSSPYPTCSDPEFDRFLFGWIVDPKDDLDPKSLSCMVDGKFDLTPNIITNIEILPNGGSRYDWQCSVPKDLLDFNRHMVEMSIKGFDGLPREFFGMPVFEPVVPPGIDFAVYPYRDILESEEDQEEPDPLRIFVAVSGRIRPEWKDSYDDLLNAWTIDGIKEPLKAQFDLQSMVLVLTLPEPLNEDSTLRFGPVYLEDGVVAEDSEIIEVYSAESIDLLCNCDYELINLLDYHDAVETESHAWAYELRVPPNPPCSLYAGPYPTQSYHLITPATPQFANQTPVGQPEDLGGFGTSYKVPWGGPPTAGKHTLRADPRDMHQFRKYLYAMNGPNVCWSATLSQDFPNADNSNPSFEEVRVVTGPDAACWLEEQSQREGAYPNALIPAQIAMLEQDTCGLYVLLRASDGDSGPGPGGISGVVADYEDRWGNPIYGLGTSLGPQITVDREPFAPAEYRSWADTAYQDHVPGHGYFPTGYIAKDYLVYHEELVMVRGLDPFLSQEAQSVYFRATDIYGNWRRTVNVLDILNTQDDLYSVAQIGIVALNYQGTTVLADFCTVPVQNRTAPPPGLSGNVCDLDIAARILVPAFVLPPTHVDCSVSAPTDEGSYGPEEIEVALYQVRHDTTPESRWQTLDDLFTGGGSVPASCDVYYFSREYDLVERDGITPIPSELYPEVYVSDSIMSTPKPFQVTEYPILFVSDEDSRLGVEGDTSSNEWKDYSIAISTHDDGAFGEATSRPLNWGVRQYWIYQQTLDSMYFGNSPRGRFDRCQAQPGYTNDYKIDILRCGLERVKVEAQGLDAELPIRSGGDVYFVIGHGIPDYLPPYEPPPGANPEERNEYQEEHLQQIHIAAIGDFRSPASTWVDIDYNEWRNEASYSDFNYLVTMGCCNLNNASFQDWKNALVDSTHLDSICGFRELNMRTGFEGGNPSSFMDEFSDQLTCQYGTVTQMNLWWDGLHVSLDPCVIAWMENACRWSRRVVSRENPSPHPIIDSAAVDDESRWIIVKEDRGLFYRESYYIVQG